VVNHPFRFLQRKKCKTNPNVVDSKAPQRCKRTRKAETDPGRRPLPTPAKLEKAHPL